MQYNTYKQKVDKVVDFFRLLFKHRVKILIAFSFVMIVVVTLMATKGIIISTDECQSLVVYGDKLDYSAKAFLSDTHNEYRSVSDTTWTTEPPIEPGDYYVRVVARATFGFRYGEAQRFTVVPRPITVTIANGEMIYGELPKVSADLAYDDTIECSDFIHTDGTNIYEALRTSIIIRNGDGKNINANYVISTEPCDVVVKPRPISITSDSYNAEYDGEWHNVNGVTITDGSLCEGHRIVAEDAKYKDAVTNLANLVRVKILDADGADQTSNYAIKLGMGMINISPKKITITSESYNGVFDANTHEFSKITVTAGELCAGHYITAGSKQYRNVVDGALNQIPFEIVNSSGNYETSNYEITKNWGRVTISPRKITVSTQSYNATYDGKWHEFYDVKVISGQLCEGHYINSVGERYRDVVEAAQNVLSFKILDYPNGKNETSNYEITREWGIITITPKKITVTTPSYKQTYDGQWHNLNTVTVTSGGLCEDHYIVAKDALYRDVVTNATNEVDFRIYDYWSEDVTINYEITKKWGTVTIISKVVDITTESNSWDYDGKPHSHDKYRINSGYGVVDGHIIDVKWATEITEVGSTKNVLEFVVTDENLENVTHNYNIKITSYGTLTIKPVSNPPSGGDNGGNGGSGGDVGSADSSGTDIGSPPVSDDLAEPVVVFVINSNKTGTVYLKECSYGDYTGSGWEKATEYDAKLLDYLSAYYLASKAAENGGAVPALMTITSKYGIYVLPYYADDTYGPVQKNDVFVVGDASYPYQVYYFDSLEGASLPSGAAEFERLYSEFVHKEYLQIGSYTKSYMQQIISSQGFYKNDPDIISKVAEYIQNAATYSKKYDRTLDASGDIAVEFLKTYKEGICQHYATAATMLFRALGIPARYTVGYVGNAVANKNVDVTTDQAHAWVEVYIDGIGWQQVEVTGGDSGGTGGSGDLDDEKKELVIKPAYQSKEYDGSPLYAKNEIVVADLLAKLVASGYTYKVSVSGSQTVVGIGKSMITSFRLFDPSGRDVTKDYIISYEEGILEVVEHLIEIYIYEKQFVYSGVENGYSKNEYLVMNIPNGIKLVINDIKISMTNAGSITSDEINENITAYIDFAVYKTGSSKDISDSYSLRVVNYGDSSSYSVLTILQRDITVTTGSSSKPYDGKPLTDNTYYISYGVLGEGHKLYVELTGTITSVGNVRNFVNKESLKISDKNGVDVTDNYNVTFDLGYLTIS